MADGLFAKVKNFFFEEEIDDILEDEELDEPVRYYNAPEREEHRDDRRRGKVVSMNNASNNVSQLPTATMKMILYKPMSYEDSQTIVDNLRARKPVILNMVDLERETAQRVLDFIAGSVYALNGTIRKVEFGIFVIVPSNMTLIGSGEDTASN